MNHALLEKWNHHVAAGDVLLLSSRGPDAVAIRFYQSRKRSLRADYTHVAIVVGPDMVADAMPVRGVGFQRWADMEADYDLEKCRVARNSLLASNPDTQQRLWQRATYYYKQPYKLTALLTPAGSLKDQAGIVCSQFVALLLDEIGVIGSSQSALKTLPIDIDTFTRASGKWRQFPFVEHGLCTRVSVVNDVQYTKDLAQAFPLELTAEQTEEAARLADEFFQKDPLQAMDDFFSRSDATLAELDDFRRQVPETLVRSMDHLYSVSQQLQNFDDATLSLTKSLQRATEIDGTDMRLDWAAIAPGAAGNPHQNPLSGASLLAQWRALFDIEKKPPLFMHAERAAQNLVERRKWLRETLETAKEVAETHIDSHKKLLSYLDDIQKLLTSGLLTADVLRSVRTLAEHLLNEQVMFSGESSADVQARIDAYAAFAEKVASHADFPDLDADVRRQALDCLLAAWALDIPRYSCIEYVHPSLLDIKSVLESLEAACHPPEVPSATTKEKLE